MWEIFFFAGRTKGFFNQFLDDDCLKAAPSRPHLSVAQGDSCRKDIAEFQFNVLAESGVSRLFLATKDSQKRHHTYI